MLCTESSCSKNFCHFLMNTCSNASFVGKNFLHLHEMSSYKRAQKVRKILLVTPATGAGLDRMRSMQCNTTDR